MYGATEKCLIRGKPHTVGCYWRITVFLKLVSHWDASAICDYFETNLRHVLATEIRHCNHNHIAVTPNG